MTLAATDFGAFHRAVHKDGQGNPRDPFPWQQRLLNKIIEDRAWPRVLDLPTGVGKTTCLDIALFALALDAANTAENRWCPRRIAMVVDRRIVVDQVAERGRKLLSILLTSDDPVVIAVAERLRSLAHRGDEPLEVYTLRGGVPKDDGWARTPDQPLIIASTVDQVGSRILMQGYGVSSGMRPIHAGLLANDTLLLLDEVHLSEPFRQTLDQLARLRSRFPAMGTTPRFAYAFLSATPGASDTVPFTLLDDEKGPQSPLGARLHARKPVRLVEVEDRLAMEAECVGQARDLLKQHRTIAVVVNRVASAGRIARQLTQMLGADATVTLLTGRMRPLDRDDVLYNLRPAAQAGRVRGKDIPRRVVVGTQCIEAGADFDFDALVTESASLDSLRQRFGRVDRLGRYGSAEGVIVHNNSAKDDPIYGSGISETIKWFKGQEKIRAKKLKRELEKLKDEAKQLRGEEKSQAKKHIVGLARVDFGVLALDLPDGDELNKLLVPKQDAPTLLPAYLDLWAQTSPAPTRLPDVSLWLHGPDSGPADVQVIWRVDLTDDMLKDPETAKGVVAAVRPSSLEALSLPFKAAQMWLAKLPVPDLGDIEGATIDEGDELKGEGRRALRWLGDKSQVVDARSVKPGHTIIVPATYGGIRDGCFDAASTDVVDDRAEQAALFARARPVLRLNHRVLEQSGLELSLDESGAARRELGLLASSDAWLDWRSLWATCLAKGGHTFVVPGEAPWTVIEAERVPIGTLRQVIQQEASLENGVELTTDSDSSYSVGRAVTLSQHSGDVEALAWEYATRCGLDAWLVEHIAVAGWLHDIGKADPRFQLMLRGGSEIELFKDERPWAKSAMPSGARIQRRLARERSGYPGGGHLHAVQSVAMLEEHTHILMKCLQKVDPAKKPDICLVLHLIASHHGDCRPLAPAIIDDKPVDVSLDNHTSDKFGEVSFSAVTSNNQLYRLDSPIADRFWKLSQKYGWQELCWLESIVRLADHRASEMEYGEGVQL